MKVYYAHSVHLYGTEQEKKDLELLDSLGFTDIVNPNNPDVQVGIELFKKEYGDEISVMSYFDNILDGVDAIAFRGHVDGTISSGVGYEIKYVQKQSKPVFELPVFIAARWLTREDTKEYLRQLGNR